MTTAEALLKARAALLTRAQECEIIAIRREYFVGCGVSTPSDWHKRASDYREAEQTLSRLNPEALEPRKT